MSRAMYPSLQSTTTKRSEERLQLRLDQAAANKQVNAGFENQERMPRNASAQTTATSMAVHPPTESSKSYSRASTSSNSFNVSPRTNGSQGRPSDQGALALVNSDGKEQGKQRGLEDRRAHSKAAVPAPPLMRRASEPVVERDTKGEYYVHRYRRVTRSATGWREVTVKEYTYLPPRW